MRSEDWFARTLVGETYTPRNPPVCNFKVLREKRSRIQ